MNSTLLRWIDAEHFGHVGLFVCDEEKGVLRVLRFYPDGRVASTSGDVSAEHVYVFSWLQPNDPAAASGRYEVHAGNHLRFSLTSGALLAGSAGPVVVDYEGTIEGEVLVLRSHSRATGYQATNRYVLQSVTGMSTLPEVH